MTAMTFLFLRHGESRANAGLATDDAASIPLTARGEDQARSLSRHFLVSPHLVVSSPYLRARRTASLALAHHSGVKIDIWPIQEFTYLAKDRCAGTNMADRAGWVSDYWRRCDPDYCDGAGAENFRQLVARARNGAPSGKSERSGCADCLVRSHAVHECVSPDRKSTAANGGLRFHAKSRR